MENNNICCDNMSNHSGKSNELDDLHDSDAIMVYVSKFDEYGILIKDGGSSYIQIQYCPWCGTKLPDSKRDEWFDELEKRGFYTPFNSEVPEEFESDRWYKKP
ncbi:MAG: hypothetical protein OEW75_16615 [Cyclobacteriaceae bacterium]|nr:hypothetical protein [Cyclobacteriaceae bacterium]